MGNTTSTFNSKEYLSKYPDLVEAGINTHEKALEHWNNHGQAEGRIYYTFNSKKYLANYPDLVAAGIDTSEKALEHWNNHGHAEGRTHTIILNFNWKQYLLNYEDLLEKRINSIDSVSEHWLDEGIKNNRICTYVDKINTGNNVLITSCHLKNYGTDILLNNLKHLLPSKITHLIIVYSIEQGYTYDIEYIRTYIETSFHINVIFINDVENKQQDWGKILLAYSYINENISDINRVFIINDSIIICNDLTIYINNFINNNYFKIIGFQESILGLQESILPEHHYQSWFLIFNGNVFIDWVNNIKLLLPKVDINDFILSSIDLIEVKLCNTFIKKYKSTAICTCDILHNPTHNINEVQFNINHRDVIIFKYKLILKLGTNKVLYDLLPEDLKNYFID